MTIEKDTNIVSRNTKVDMIPNFLNEVVEWNIYIKRDTKTQEPYQIVYVSIVDVILTGSTRMGVNDIAQSKNLGKKVRKKYLFRSRVMSVHNILFISLDLSILDIVE